MTPEEAIKRLAIVDSAPTINVSKEFKKAAYLGIEALKRERECRENIPREEWLLLPGETEE